jgi:curli biogenesis system outer membrane secretion channel CsgG
MRPGRAFVTAVAAFALAAGCAPGIRLYANPDADMTAYRQLAFLPFTNLSAERFAAERIARALMTELIIAGRYRIVESAQTLAVLDELGVVVADPTRGPTPEKLKEAAARLGVQGYVRGAVTEYQIQRLGGEEAAVIAFDVEMIDAPTGTVVWRAAVSRRGRGRLPVLGGAGTRSFGRLTEQACREVVARLKASAF